MVAVNYNFIRIHQAIVFSIDFLEWFENSLVRHVDLDAFTFLHHQIRCYSCHLKIARHTRTPTITATINPTIPMIISRPEPVRVTSPYS